MMKSVLCLAALALAAPGCSGEESKEPPAVTATVPAAGGPLCEEHGVPESMCTKCNPELIPIFKKKGDWCEEHGFPESVCPICHPPKGKVAAADEKPEDGAPADGTMVRFKTLETARMAGIETAVAAPASGDRGFLVNARIAYDATRVAAVNPRAPGVVSALRADVGAKVARGAVLATLRSAEVGGARSRLEAADTRVRIAEENHRRELDLAAKKISAQKDVLAAEQELEQARAERKAIRAELGVVGGGGEGGSYSLTAPIAGVVTERGATVGNLVGVETALFQIVDTSRMWAELEIPETDLPQVAAGQEVEVTIDGTERAFRGTVSYLAPAIDPTTRTAVARVSLANPDGALRANMFGQAAIAIGAARDAAVVPRAALQKARGVNLVFVVQSEGQYQTRRVQVAGGEGDQVQITAGIKPGERVVTSGSFLLKTETLKESIGSGCCDVD